MQCFWLVDSRCFGLTLLKLSRCLSLFDNCNFVTKVDQHVQIFVQSFLWKANVQLLRVAHPIEVQQFVAQNGIVVKDLIELSKLEKEHFFKVVLLKVPILSHARRKVLPFTRRNM